MRKWKQLVGALLLTVFLIGLGLVNGTELLADRDSQIAEVAITCAATAPFPEIRLKKPQYDDDGNLIGCYGKGNKCVIVVATVAGTQYELLVTANAVMLK